jgi:hypothetical protein
MVVRAYPNMALDEEEISLISHRPQPPKSWEIPMSRPPPLPRAREEPQHLEEGTSETSPSSQSTCASDLDLHQVLLGRILERFRRAGSHEQTLVDPFFERPLRPHLQRLP